MVTSDEDLEKHVMQGGEVMAFGAPQKLPEGLENLIIEILNHYPKINSAYLVQSFLPDSSQSPYLPTEEEATYILMLAANMTNIEPNDLEEVFKQIGKNIKSLKEEFILDMTAYDTAEIDDVIDGVVKAFYTR